MNFHYLYIKVTHSNVFFLYFSCNCHRRKINTIDMIFKLEMKLLNMVEVSVYGNHPHVWLVAILVSTFLFIANSPILSCELQIYISDCWNHLHLGVYRHPLMFKAKYPSLFVVLNNSILSSA